MIDDVFDAEALAHVHIAVVLVLVGLVVFAGSFRRQLARQVQDRVDVLDHARKDLAARQPACIAERLDRDLI